MDHVLFIHIKRWSRKVEGLSSIPAWDSIKGKVLFFVQFDGRQLFIVSTEPMPNLECAIETIVACFVIVSIKSSLFSVYLYRKKPILWHRPRMFQYMIKKTNVFDTYPERRTARIIKIRNKSSEDWRTCAFLIMWKGFHYAWLVDYLFWPFLTIQWIIF